MSYSTIEALWLTRLQAMSQFHAHNSSRGKWGQRNTGESDHYAVLKPGLRERPKLGMGGSKQAIHQTIVQLWQRYKEHGDSMINLEILVQNVEDELDKYPRLGDATNMIISAGVVEVREFQEVYPDAKAKVPSWLYVELVGECNEEITITYS